MLESKSQYTKKRSVRMKLDEDQSYEVESEKKTLCNEFLYEQFYVEMYILVGWRRLKNER